MNWSNMVMGALGSDTPEMEEPSESLSEAGAEGQEKGSGGARWLSWSGGVKSCGPSEVTLWIPNWVITGVEV